MPTKMYAVAGDCPSNEELAQRIQAGDQRAAGLLISQNEGYLTKLARSYDKWCGLEDLKQEGAMALLEAAKQFDSSYGTKLLTYATPAIESTMMDHAAQASLSLRIPSSRYNQLRKVANIYAEAEDKSVPALIQAVCKKIQVSPTVAEELLKEYQTLLPTKTYRLGKDGRLSNFTSNAGGSQSQGAESSMVLSWHRPVRWEKNDLSGSGGTAQL